MRNEPLPRSVALHKALGHPIRLRILAMLQSGELCVCQITAAIGLAPSTISAHLSELKGAGLVNERKVRRFVIYAHPPDAPTRQVIAQTLGGLRSDPQIEVDRRVVKRLRRVPLEKLCRAELDLSRVGARCPAPTRKAIA